MKLRIKFNLIHDRVIYAQGEIIEGERADALLSSLKNLVEKDLVEILEENPEPPKPFEKPIQMISPSEGLPAGHEFSGKKAKAKKGK